MDFVYERTRPVANDVQLVVFVDFRLCKTAATAMVLDCAAAASWLADIVAHQLSELAFVEPHITFIVNAGINDVIVLWLCWR